MRKVLIKPSVLGLIINVFEDVVAEEEEGDHGVAGVEADLKSILNSQWMNLVLAKMMVPEEEEDMAEVEARNHMIKGSSSKKNKKGDEAHLAQDESDSESDHVLLMVTTNSEEDESCWYLYTGCSNHMTRRREWLIDLDPSVRSNVKFTDNSTITAEGVRKVMITRKDGKTAYMSDVLYVPNMKNNLLCLGQLLEKGYTMSMQQNHIEVYDGQ
ncbi:uncharacterized protein LOC114184355 [Vigna unguiculata]|uniref:uncharacterized protein LOC114184355 n=1 Tax=Vigna unguiculata TaxID=3917 RepID=UPI001016B7FF|nr:uncharacterized protein LOC114184355 [Vigna unguiculata]